MNFGLILNNFALATFDVTQPAFSAERWKYVGQMTLIGMGLVFSVLAILMLVLMMFKVIFAGPAKKAPKSPAVKKTEALASVRAENASDDVINAVIAAGIQAYQADSNEALIAVITAAVAAHRASEGLDTDGFRVVSFRRAGNGHWNSKR